MNKVSIIIIIYFLTYFVRNYDPIKDEERMTTLGLFQSAASSSNSVNESTEPASTEELQ